MRVLHLSDTHLGVDRWYRGAPPGWRRGDDHLTAMRTALEPAFAGRVDLVLHTGDVFDRSKPPPAAVFAGFSLLCEVARRVPTVVMPGNHDRLGLASHFRAAPSGLIVVDQPTTLHVAGLRIVAIPYQHDPEHWAAAATQLYDRDTHLVLAHQAFEGSSVPGFTFYPGPGRDTVAARQLPPFAGTILNGHIHTQQDLALAGWRIIHGGSTERTSFFERNEPKGSLVLDLGGTRAQVERLDAQPRAMVQVNNPTDLAKIKPETLVSLGKAMRNDEVEHEALARGGWVAPWTRPTQQASLFHR